MCILVTQKGFNMDDTLMSKSLARRNRLINTYRKSAQFGLVLGAGVTVASRVPDYMNLAIKILETAAKQPQFTGSGDWVQNLVDHQRKQRRQKGVTIPPDELILCARMLLGNDEGLLRRLVKQELYKEVSVETTAGRGVFEDNPTLDAILTFCSARPGTILSPGGSRYKVEVNNKIGGILTTNYDNLVESAFHTKYRRNLLKPVGRPSTNEFEKRERRTIPVYHIHGYVGFRSSESEARQTQNPNMVISEDDYFETFYDPLGFSNYIAMSFLRRYPSLFIGSGMTDKNLRRFLFHLYSTTGGRLLDHQRKFAILKSFDSPLDAFMDTVLFAYGVETIWIKKFAEIPKILQEMYTAANKKDAAKSLNDDWKYLKIFSWR
jgi:hypothetical protein